jgi:lipid-binding SYLF domain-containing protein
MRIRSVVLVLASCGFLFAQSEHAKRLVEAADVLKEVMETPDKGIPQDLLDKAECAVIVPSLKKGAFIFGAKYGRGFMSCRTGNAGWSAPGSVRVEGGSFGFQIGGSETDVIMLVMNERGAKRLLSSKFTLGGDASVAAGPVGRTASAETDAYMRAEILTWSRSRGVFAGISLQGATLRQDASANKDLYGHAYENKDIVVKGVKAPASAAKLLGLLNKYSSRK